MKNIITLAILLATAGLSAQVGIGTKTPDASAILDINVDNLPANAKKGLLPPRMSTGERDAIASPAEGLTIYNTTNKCIEYWNATNWISACDGSVVTTQPITALTCSSAGFSTSHFYVSESYLGTATVPYTGGNGTGYSAGTSIASTGVTGLTATLQAGTLATGDGNLTYNITGTASTRGFASFAISFGGQSCTMVISSCDFQLGQTPVVAIVSPITGRIWMDRNLGAFRAATSSTDESAYGDLYQFGRRTDGHQCRLSSTTTTRSTTAQVPAPNTRLFTTVSEWYMGSTPPLQDLWNETNTGVNDVVCPTGYRLPLMAEWDAETATWGTDKEASAFSNLKLTLGGRRGGGTANLLETGINGFYFSGTAGSGARTLNYTSTTVSTTNASFNTASSVRCIKN